MSAGFRQAGDGDRCPQDPEHGRMWFASDRQSQWCPHSGHKGINRYAFDGVTPKPRVLGDTARR